MSPSSSGVQTEAWEVRPSPSASSVKRRGTRQQSAILALLADIGEFRSAQALHDLLRARAENVGLTTVYRTLHALTDAGVLDTIRTGRGEVLYRRCSAVHHHHLVCRHCRRTVEITSPAVMRWIAQVAAEHGYRDVEHELEITGTCPGCDPVSATWSCRWHRPALGPDDPQPRDHRHSVSPPDRVKQGIPKKD
ncbi:MAG: transcriptional repressor [Actinophytocola sp.]|uniref:Fur family transcriptional regulator n=1 Tax=Actinophytocola sp. TaxID=1872138 RepID=UPI001321280F|nr:transcriptional repressor [Actinophytocola sp.]